MFVNYSGWSENKGLFSVDIFIDENRTDYTLVYGDGTVVKQMTPFQAVTADWNNDGDIYTQFGAWFESPSYGGNSFLTPEEMVQAVIDAGEKTHFFANEIKDIPGIEIPALNHISTFDDLLRDSEHRATKQRTNRNPKRNTPSDPSHQR